MKKLPRITEFDGLRGLLAWWVVASHLLYNSGFGTGSEQNIFLRLLRNGRYPVDVFIILSGFVIFFLLEYRQETYRAFILRRFFRLYPVYIVCFLISLLIADISIHNMESLPWSSELTDYIARAKQEKQYYWQHILAHSLMLHGIFPNELLPNSTNAFLSPAWSISLEWQFYLVAPFIFISLKRSPIYFLVISGAVILLHKYAHLAGYYPNPGFLPLKAELFWVGGVSFYILKLASKQGSSLTGNRRLYGAASLTTLVVLIVADYRIAIGLILWITVFGAVLAKTYRTSNAASLLVTRILNNRYLQGMGKMSYSTYLAHVPIIYICQWAILSMFPSMIKKEMLMLLSLSAVPIIFLVSSASFKLIEKPLIKLGARLAETL